MANDLSLLLAVGAGLLSFASPCVLPLIPSYLTFIGGASLSDLKEGTISRSRLLLRTLFFVLGFTLVFVALGIFLSGSVALMGGTTRIINYAAGSIVILLGLNIIFDFISFVNMEKRFHPQQKPKNIAGSFLIGMAFGAGWSPCVGPILGGILFLAGQTGEIGRAVLYLAAYSLGLGLPFFAAAYFFNTFLGYLSRIKNHLGKIKTASGLLLVFIGFLIFFGKFQELNRMILVAGYALSDFGGSGSAAARFLPAVILFVLGCFPLCVARARRKKVATRGKVLFFVLPLVLAVLHIARVIDITSILSGWLLYQGI